MLVLDGEAALTLRLPSLMTHDQGSEEAPTEWTGASTAEIFCQLLDELKRLAAYKLGSERNEHTLQATALVNEVYLRFGEQGRAFEWENKRQFFSYASEVMRRILVDHARKKKSLRRGGGAEQTEFDDSMLVFAGPPEELLAVHEVLDRLSEADEQAAELVKLRYFAGLTMPEAAAAQDLSERTAHRVWAKAKEWLYRELK